MGGRKIAKAQAKFNAQDEKEMKLQIKELIALGSDFKMPRIKSGVQGLDELMEGGVPERSLVLVAGDTGTGKSTLAMNFLVEGAQNNEPGVYVTLEESASEHALRMKLFGWPIENLIAEKKLAFVQPELYDFDKLIVNIEDAVTRIGAKRLVIDSISILNMYFKDPFKVRRSLLTLEKAVKNLNCTTFVIAELRQIGGNIQLTGVEEFLVDGIILLHYIKKENVYSRAMVIRKMRATNHSLKIHPMQIKRPGGVIIYPEEEVFTEL
ncbi:MAG: ATPase domain-containing protein [Candidatus Diapherotrites archaeon]